MDERPQLPITGIVGIVTKRLLSGSHLNAEQLVPSQNFWEHSPFNMAENLN